MEMNAAGSVYDASTSPPLVSQGATGAITGGILRPGSIDQGAFVQALAEAQQNRETAGVGGKPVPMPMQSFQSNIPTLSSAQFAALVGAQSDSPAISNADDGAAADPQAVSRAAAPTAAAQAYGMPQATAQKLTGRPAIPTPTATPAGASAASASDEEAPIFERIGEPKLQNFAATSSGEQAMAGAAAQPDTANPDAAAGDQAAAASKPLPPPDPNVVHLRDAPDRETQRNLMAQHKRWVVDETPGARQLFFGADGKFGWDDFLDVINPLQHIPIVAQIYRAVTGDEINGAAELIGALPFGPLGVVGMMGTVADLAVKDTTGKDIGENLEAMVFGGGDKKSAPSPADTSDMAEASPVHPDLGMQTASAEPAGGELGAASTAHDQRKA
jgi:hypothetical protein